VLTHAAQTIASEFPSVTVHARVCDFDEPLGELPGELGRRVVAFLGSTIGNFAADGRVALYQRIRDSLAEGDHFLIGADLRKDPRRLVNAYDDAAGVTAEFNRNLIRVLRRELDAKGLDPDDFVHVARWNAHLGRIEMWLRATRDIHAWFRTIDRDWELPAGGELLTEISVKFDLPKLHAELEGTGFDVVETWTDTAGDFSLSLAVVA
jgi:L-histidine N-alpha-methyltransferase